MCVAFQKPLNFQKIAAINFAVCGVFEFYLIWCLKEMTEVQYWESKLSKAGLYNMPVAFVNDSKILC